MKDVKEYMHSEVCEANVIHQDVVAKVRENMQDEDPIYEVAELFKVFGDSTRARIICDYIAGMTDQYAIQMYSDAFIPLAWRVK